MWKNVKKLKSRSILINIINFSNLTCIEPAYGIFVLWFRPKKQQFSVALPTP